MALLAARQNVSGDVCVVDCGSAVTVDVLARSGEHWGGVILPGLSLLRDAFRRGTKVPSSVLAPNGPTQLTKQRFGKNTADAIYLGSCYAIAGLIDHVVGKAEQQLGTKISLMITGGDAPAIQCEVSRGCEYFPYLVLQGIALSVGLDARTWNCVVDDRREGVDVFC
jgi:type III pantothenate kinase